jgi:hypothetical protein
MRDLMNIVEGITPENVMIMEGRDAALWHGYRDAWKAIAALNKNEMGGTTTQRFWADGKRRKDNDPEYEDSYWMKGISLTRDPHFAMKWGDVMIKLDQAKIAQRYKIIPFNWGYSIPSGNHHKNEREEFVVTKSTLDKYNGEDDEKDSENPNPLRRRVMGDEWERFKAAEGAVKPLDQFLIAIYISSMNGPYGSFPLKDEELEFLTSHPKFAGWYNQETGNFTQQPEVMKSRWAKD